MTLPTGTVTFLFTDVQRSTRMWEEHAESMSAALTRHDKIMRHAIESNGGYVFTTAGDAFAAAFQTAPSAIAAALASQQALDREEWGETPVKVRMAMHTGRAEERDGDYFGPTLNRCARLQSTSAGGQVVISLATYDQLNSGLPDGVTFRDMGEHRLKDLSQPERVYQLLHPDLEEEFPPLKSLNAYTHNLPIQVTSFVGRHDDLKAVEALLVSSRVVTLLGPGGAGKTRMSLQAAAHMLPEFTGGIKMVELAGLTDPELIVEQTATALEINQQRGQSLRETIFERLGDKKTLILMDNCEHLIEAAAAFIQELATKTAATTIMTTSREPLRIDGEAIYNIPPLPVPDEHATTQNMEQIPSVQLFVERATAVNPAFRLNDDTRDAVLKLCRRLDGLPLALELAAARTRALSPRRIADGLDNLFRILTGNSRTALPHHRTLEAAVDWSYEMLEEREKLLLRRLSVFSGGFTDLAAEAVCSDGQLAADEVLGGVTELVDKALVQKLLPTPPSASDQAVDADEQLESFEVLDGVIELVDKSLVATSTDEHGEIRYRLLEIIREYARGKLRETGETETFQRRHLAWFAIQAQRAVDEAVGPRQAELFRELVTEQDNFRAAMELALSGVDTATGCQMASALSQVWTVVTAYLPEGLVWLERAIAHVGDDQQLRATLLSRLAAVHFLLGDFTASAAAIDEALPLAEQLEDKKGLPNLLHMAGSVARNRADYETADQRYHRAAELHRDAGDQARLAYVLGALGDLHCMQDHLDESWQHYSDALELSRKVGHKGAETAILDGMSMVAAKQGRLDEAMEMNEQGLAIAKELGDSMNQAMHSHDRAVIYRAKGKAEEAERLFAESLGLMKELRAWQSVACLEGLGAVAMDRGDQDRAAVLFAAAGRQRDTVALHKNWRWSYDTAVDELKSECTGEGCLIAWGRGAAMTLDQAVDFALERQAH